MLACFVPAGYAVSRVVAAGVWPGFVVWFVGAAIIHDLVLYPLYALADVAGRPRRRSVPPVTNHVRVPAALSGLLLLVWFPLILGASEREYVASVGLDTSPYLGRWLLVTGVLFAGSALVHAVRRRRAGSRTPAGPGPGRSAGENR
jgi:hypothetical protein